jgi:hypothetical protein
VRSGRRKATIIETLLTAPDELWSRQISWFVCKATELLGANGNDDRAG